MDDHGFELSIPPSLCLHPVFNVDILCPYIPPFLDTLEVVEQLAPIEINPNYMEKETIDRILDIQVKGVSYQLVQVLQCKIFLSKMRH